MDYKVRFVGYPRHYKNLETEIDGVIKEVLRNGDYIMRQHLEDFENHLADFIGVKHAVGLNSGTDALYLSLLAANIGAEDEVITVAHTFLATVGAIVNCGATPILIDIGPDHNMNVDQFEKAITPKTRAIIPVYLNGRICDMNKLMPIAEKHNLIVIEDSAQALGANYRGKMAGSFGLTACFSFYPAKILGTAGDGGAVSTNDDQVAASIRALRDNGRIMGQDQVVGYGFNSRLDNIQAAILDVKLKYLPGWIERRREIANIYTEGLSDIPALTLPPTPSDDSIYYDAYQNYAITTPQRDKLVAHLTEQGVETIISWPIPMHHQKALKLDHFRLPETERLSDEVVSLPMFPELTDEEVSYVVQTVSNFYAE